MSVAPVVPAVAPFALKVLSVTFGSVTFLSAAPATFVSIEHVVSVTAPVKVIVPSAALAPVEARAKVARVAAAATVEMNDFMNVSNKEMNKGYVDTCGA